MPPVHPFGTDGLALLWQVPQHYSSAYICSWECSWVGRFRQVAHWFLEDALATFIATVRPLTSVLLFIGYYMCEKENSECFNEHASC